MLTAAAAVYESTVNMWRSTHNAFNNTGIRIILTNPYRLAHHKERQKDRQGRCVQTGNLSPGWHDAQDPRSRRIHTQYQNIYDIMSD